MDGILLVDKPSGWTSHDVVKKIKNLLKLKKAGHAGTLDPMATGLLIICLDNATKWAGRLTACDKEYIVTAEFGAATDTYDADGRVTAVCKVPDGLDMCVRSIIPRFSGEIRQVPPAYSAVKYRGRPLYKYARKGEPIPANILRSVKIDVLDILETDGFRVSLRVVCSAGTYIRSLVHDMGLELGCGAHVTSLRRLRCGGFYVDNAVKMQDICKTGFCEGLNRVLIKEI